MGLFTSFGQVWRFARNVEELFQLQDMTEKALDALNERILQLEIRITNIEADRGQMIVEAKAAAGMAASGVVSNVVADIITRITRLEMWQTDKTNPPAAPHHAG